MYTMEDLDILPPLLIIIMVAAYRQHLRSRRSEGRAGQDHGFFGDKSLGRIILLKKELSQEDHESYKFFVRKTKEDYTELLEKVSPFIVKKRTL